MRKHFPLHRVRASQAQQLPLVQRLDENATPDATTAGQTNLAILSDGCPRCQQVAERHSKHVPVCRECYEALRQEATETQEQQYLARWLHSRVDVRGNPFEESALVASPNDRMVALRLVRDRARPLNLNWVNPPQMQSFASLMRAFLAPFGGGDDSGEAA